MSINNKKVRRLSTAMVGCALTITLASCSAATNKYGNLDKKATYASIGDYSITNGELWDELQWDAKDVLDTQVYNVILDEQITRLTKVFNTDGKYSNLEDKKIIHGSDDEISEESFNKLYDKYRLRIVDYVVQDVFNFNYSQEDYWGKVNDLDNTDRKTLARKYADEMYVSYQKNTIADGTSYEKIINDAVADYDDDHELSDDSNDMLFAIAKDLCELYYPMYAKELFTYDTLKDEVKEAFEDDDDDEDEKYGYYKNSEYIDMFKEKYTNQYNVNMIKIKFSSSTEFTDTLRAFGLYMYSTESKYYFIKDKEDNQTYTSYVDYYKEFTSSNTAKNLKGEGAEEVPSRAVLEIYIMLYNYMYGEYLDELESACGVDISFDDLNALRAQTLKIINKYKVEDQNELYNNTIAALKAFDDARSDDQKVLTFTPDYLDDTYSVSFKTYCYETLKLVDDKNKENFDTRYSTSLQSAGDSSVIIYKFDDTFDEITDEKAKEYEEFYRNKDNTSLDYFEYLTKDENKELFDEVLDALIWNNTSETIITNKVSDALEDVKIKIYNEATEIAYSKEHTDYSKAVGSAKNKNILATIKYNKKTYNLNIKANDKDSKSILVPGTNEAFGVYNYLERKSGASTAIDLLSKKIIKDTKQYKEALKDKDQKEIFQTYLKNVLTSFANDGLASNGYPSTLGKYNFLMLYFHNANVNKIINDYFMVQYTSSKLLTDYSNEKLAEFFEEYTKSLYKKYFSLSGKRLVIYMDADEDGKKDTKTKEVTIDGETKQVLEWTTDKVTNKYWTNTSKGEIAKELAYEFYKRISAAANTSHADKLEELVDEYNDSARAEYNGNYAAPENTWAKYKQIGLMVEIDDVSATNSTTTVDSNIKQRLYDYATKDEYQYFLNNDAIPTEFMEIISESDISDASDKFITSKDGINLLIVTSGNAPASAEWKQEDYEDTPLKNIIIKYNEKYVTISDIYNEGKELNINQIMLYIIDSAVNSSSSLSPADTADALSSFLSPVYSRFTGSETQRIVLLYFMKAYTKSNEKVDNLIKFANESYNGKDGYFYTIVKINQDVADDYIDYNGDESVDSDGKKLSDVYNGWWKKLNDQIEEFLINLEEAE